MSTEPLPVWASEECVEAVARAIVENVAAEIVNWECLDEWARDLARGDARAALRAAEPFVERWADEATYGAHEMRAGESLAQCERFNAGVLAARQALGLGPSRSGSGEGEG